MKNFILFIFLFIFGNYYLQAQTDTTRVQKIDNETSKTVTTNKLQGNFTQKKVGINNSSKKINKETVDKFLNSAPRQPQNILLENRPEDNDVVGKKYWMGKDVTHKKPKSSYSLGTIYSTSKEVRIECRDHSYIDGDRIQILVNDYPVSTNIGLKGNYFVYYLTLDKGYNKISFQALNQGSSGPNTAELKVFDDKGNLISDKQWNLATGQIATLGIIKKANK
ncbi:MAG TPA: hypothetical protein VJ970_05060 [Flavobacteriaceae bacterium]|nr:hypothetical protein [Flavobacteriaceae bacterium]